MKCIYQTFPLSRLKQETKYIEERLVLKVNFGLTEDTIIRFRKIMNYIREHVVFYILVIVVWYY